MRSPLAALFAVALSSSQATAAPRVALCGADGNGALPDLKARLEASATFAAVDLLDCGAATPTVAQLKGWDAVLVLSQQKLHDPKALGDALADYADAGGGVVLTQFALSTGFGTALEGRWAADRYDCLAPGKILYQSEQTKQKPNDPQSPLVAGVVSLESQFRAASALNVARGAVSVWDFGDGAPAVCRMLADRRPRIDLNFYPGPGGKFYTEGQPGDGATLLRNALLHVAGGFHPLRGAPSPAAFADTGTGARSPGRAITFTNTTQAPQKIDAIAIGGANAGDFQITKAPVLPVPVPPGGSLTVEVAFAPLQPGPRAAALALVSGGVRAGEVALVGRGVGAQLVVTPSPLVFGSSQLGVPVAKNLTVANPGPGKLTLKSAAITVGGGAFKVIAAPALPLTLAAATSATLTVAFTPQAPGNTPGTLRLLSDDPLFPIIDVPLLGSAGPPAVAVDPGVASFASTNVGASSPPLSIAVTNPGFSDLKVTDLAVGGANPGDFLVDRMQVVGTPIPPGGTLRFAIAFRPAAAGSRTATVTLTSNAGQKSVSCLGTGTAAQLKVTPAALAFPPTPLKTPSPAQELAIANPGTGALKVVALTFAGTDAASFSQGGNPQAPFSIAAGASQGVSLRCTPQAVGALAATLTVTGDVGQAVVALTCTGTAPAVAVAPASLDFGAVAVGATSSPREVVIANAGTGALHVNFLGLDGAGAASFALVAPPKLPATVPPKASLKIALAFSPAARGAQAAALHIGSDDPRAPDAMVALAGRGVEGGLEVAPPGVDFGRVLVGQSAAFALRLKNPGDGAVTVDRLILEGSPWFAVDAKIPFALAPGAEHTITLRFAPAAPTAAAAMLTVVAPPLAPLVVPLRGAGASATLVATPGALRFDELPVGVASPPVAVTLRNAGPTMVELAAIASSGAEFAISDAPALPLPLGAGEEARFSVTFTPSAPGERSARIEVTLAGQAAAALVLPASGSGATMVAQATGCSLARTAPGPHALAQLFSALVILASWRRRPRKDRAHA